MDATQNCLGPNGGNYKTVSVSKGTRYEVKFKSGKAVFASRGAEMVDVGIMYVDLNDQMHITTVSKGNSTPVVCRGNLYFFFVDNADQNSGGVNLEIVPF